MKIYRRNNPTDTYEKLKLSGQRFKKVGLPHLDMDTIYNIPNQTSQFKNTRKYSYMLQSCVFIKQF